MKRFEIQITKQGLDLVADEAIVIESNDVIGAIHGLHKRLQTKDGFAPNQYKIKSIHHVYGADVSNTQMVRSEYPVVGGPNPDVRTKV